MYNYVVEAYYVHTLTTDPQLFTYETTSIIIIPRFHSIWDVENIGITIVIFERSFNNVKGMIDLTVIEKTSKLVIWLIISLMG